MQEKKPNATDLFREIDDLNCKASAIIDLMFDAHQASHDISSESVGWACMVVNQMIREANNKSRQLHALKCKELEVTS